MKKTIPIFYAIDDEYSKFVAVSIKSLIMNANKDYNYDINIIYENLSKENAEKLKSLETENCKIILTEMNKNLSMITDKLGNRLREYTFTLTIYFRIFIPVMFPQYDNVFISIQIQLFQVIFQSFSTKNLKTII